jgi:predicted O-methyltransferase YrrM
MFDAQQASTPPPSHYEQVVDSQSIALIQQQAIELMRQCDGWCSEQKGAYLVDLIVRSKPEVIVEIGVYGGKSLVPMAHALRANQKGVIYGIDPWDAAESVKEVKEEANLAYWGHLDHQYIKRALIRNIYKFGLHQQIVLVESTSENAPPIQNIGFLHIDGNHSEATSYFDVTKWVPLVKSGGYIVLDDMTWYEKGHFTTAKACQWMDEHCIKVAEFMDNCQWGVWVKP